MKIPRRIFVDPYLPRPPLVPSPSPVPLPGMIGGEYDRLPGAPAPGAFIHHQTPPHASLFRPHPHQNIWQRRHRHFM